MNTPKSYKIALLFNANKAYDREILTGVAGYLQSTRISWDIYMEEDFRCRINGIDTFTGDGFIADFDDPEVCDAMQGIKVPVVAVGGSYEDPRKYPVGIPYVATDNVAMVKLAFDHLLEMGLTRFAMFGVPEAMGNRWAQERENAFCRLMQRDQMWGEVYRGYPTTASTWTETTNRLVQWLQDLPKPIGIIAVTDARARQLLQACTIAGIVVPEQVAIVGIDDDPLGRILSRTPLTSVMQGAREMGRTAAHLLHKLLGGGEMPGVRVMVPPAGINVQASSRHQTCKHPSVMRALHFIRQYACQGIKTEQVAHYVGVSRSTLDAHFRNELGHSVHDEILANKLNAARRTLANESTQISDVATLCGFTTVQYLNAVFRREMNCTPREFRDRSIAARDVSVESK